MYETLINYVKGELEEKLIKKTTNIFSGWVFSEKVGVCPVRCKYNSTTIVAEVLTRSDICDKFNRNNIILCGWLFEVPQNKYCEFQIKLESNWQTFMYIDTRDTIQKSLQEPLQEPSVIIIDNFYNDPTSIIENYKCGNPPIHPPSHFQDKFEQILGSKINISNNYEFQNICSIILYNYPIVINNGNNKFGIIFLTPDAPANTGITLYRKKVVIDEDATDFEKVDIIGNVYNRLVICNTEQIKAISHNFLNNIPNNRLTHMFAFDIKYNLD